jgi:hypothetical protein
MKWISRKFGITVFAVAAITLISGSAQSAMGQSARPLVSIPGPLLTVQTNMTSFFALAMDPATGRTFVSHPDDNKITIYEPTGVPTGTVISGVAKPTDIVAVNGVVYALLEGSGQIIRIDPATQLVSVVSSGLPTPHGLGFTDGKLWTVKTTGLGWTDRILLSIHPLTAAQQEFTFSSGGLAPELERIATSTLHPGVLFGSYANGFSPGGLNRLVVSTGQFVHLHDTVGEVKFLGDGSLLAVREFPNIGSYNPVSVQPSDKRWIPTGNTASPVAYNGGLRSVAVAYGNAVTIFDAENTALWYRRFTFAPSHAIQANGLLVAPDDSRIVVVTRNSALTTIGKVTVSTLASVGLQSASSAHPVVGNTVRLPSSPSTPLSVAARVPATQVFPPTLRMNGYSSSVAEPTSGRIFVASGVDDLIDVFGPDGRDIGSISNTANPTYLVEFNGFVYALLADQGSIVQIDPISLAISTLATGLVRPSSLAEVNGSIWTLDQASWPQGNLIQVNPISKSVIRHTSVAVYPGSTQLFRTGIGSSLFGFALAGLYDLNRVETAPTPSVTAAFAEFSGARITAVVPSRNVVLVNGEIGNSVRQFSATSMVDSGVTYPGTWPAVSNTSGTLVVTRSGSSLTSYSFGPSPQALRTITINNTYTVVAHDFMPNSTVVWGVLKNNTTGAHLFSILFDAQPSALAPIENGGELTTPEQIPVIGFDATQTGSQILTGPVSPSVVKADPLLSKSGNQEITPAFPVSVPSPESPPLIFPAIDPNLPEDQPPVADTGFPSRMPTGGLPSNTKPSNEEPGTSAAKSVAVSDQKPSEQTVVQTPTPSAVLAQPQPSVRKNARPIIRSAPRIATKPHAKRPRK